MKPQILKSLGLASALIVLPGFALAQNQAGAVQLKPADAVLVQALDAKSAKPGQNVTARLTSSIETSDGVKLPSGTELLGRVDTVKASEEKGASTLSLTFNQARLKDGKTLPVKATLVGFSPAGSSDVLPGSVAPDGAFDQEPGAIGAVAMHSEVQQNVSGTLTDAHHNIRLGQGTQLMIAVGVKGQSAVVGN
jgi:hypothetical protein